MTNPYYHQMNVTSSGFDGKETIPAYSAMELKGVTKEKEVTLEADFLQVGTYDYVKFSVENGGNYYHTLGSDVVTGSSNGNSNGSNSLVGTWSETSACSNANGDYNHYDFGSSSGYFFQTDCNSVCAPNYGVKFPFSYTSTSTSFTLSHSTPDGGCGTTLNTPSDITRDYSISGNNLTVTNPNNGASTTLVKQ